MIDSLKPYPAMKDSSVAWLGDVPAHWQVRRLRSFSSILNGATPSSNSPDYWDGKITWITPQDLGFNGDKYIGVSARKITQAGYDSCAATIAGAGALAISIRAPIGHVAILNSPACVNQGCRLIVPDGASVQPEYLYYCLLLTKSEMNSLGNGTTFAELSGNALASLRVTIPPNVEQMAIVRFLDHIDERIDRYIRAKENVIGAIERGQRYTGLLQEYLARLIADVVTGKLDVREVAAVLPEVDPLAGNSDIGTPFDAGGKPALGHVQEPADTAP